jgi:uncharacterized membrane protein
MRTLESICAATSLIMLFHEHKKVTDQIISLTDQNTTAFKEVAIIRHPRIGEYAFGFITSTVVLQVPDFLYIQKHAKDEFALK